MIYANNKLLSYIGIGDSYCLATEYIDDEEYTKKVLSFDKYYPHPTYHSSLAAGMYSDDTHMSIGCAEVLLENDIDSLTELGFANKWVEVYQRDPRNGYSKGFQNVLNSVSSGEELLNTLDNSSNKNGAAMRSVPFGVINNPNKMLELTKLQASITHNTIGGVFSSRAVALMAHFAMWEDLPMEYYILKRYLLDYLHDDMQEIFDKSLADAIFYKYNDRIAGSEMGLITVNAVFSVLTSSSSLLQILEKTIKLGGDTDSVGAIALGIASCRINNDYVDDLPGFMFSDLEPNSKYGTHFLNDLSKSLMNKFKEPS